MKTIAKGKTEQLRATIAPHLEVAKSRAKKSGHEFTAGQIDESQDTSTPDGGWCEWVLEVNDPWEFFTLQFPDEVVATLEDAADESCFVSSPTEIGLDSEFEAICEAYNQGAAEACEAYQKAIFDRLDAAGEAGFRICVFGLPGKNTHEAELAVPGEVDSVMASLWNPGPHGPYESEILTPRKAWDCKYREGTQVYQDQIDEILEVF